MDLHGGRTDFAQQSLPYDRGGAEAGTERVLAEIDRDFVYQSVKSGNLNYYRALFPAQTGWPVQFAYSDGAGNDDQTGLISLGPTVVANLNSEFQGLYGLVSPYRVTSRAAPLNQNHDLSATVVQEFELARIPIFQYAIFYSIDLEINPVPNGRPRQDPQQRRNLCRPIRQAGV